MKGFTLVELMVGILIVAILATAAIPIFRGSTDAAKWSEGKAIMGTMATALRAHVALNGPASVGTPTLTELGILPGGLDGAYFTGGESGAGEFSWIINDDNPLDFLITATAPPGITKPSKITLDAIGHWAITP